MRNAKRRGTVRAKLKRGDRVVFVAGKEYNRYDSEGKRNPYLGKVIAVDPYIRKVKVEGAMMVKKHQKANPQLKVEGGILNQEAWVDFSNVAHVDPKTGKPTRIGYEIRDGKKVRVAKKSGEIIPEPSPYVKAQKAKAEENSEEKPEKTEETEEKIEAKVETAADEVKEDKKQSDEKDKK